MLDRYFAQEPLAGQRARLLADEAHHLSHVMRARPGDEVLLFDGRGAEWQARVVRIGRSEVELELLERFEVDRELPFELTLGVALPKGDRQRWLVEKSVEIGVRRLTPLATERGIAQPVEKALVRMRRTVIEAAKQCGRNRLLEITAPVSAVDYFRAQAETDCWRALADPGGPQSLRLWLADVRRGPRRSVCVAVGPEGGFSEQEIAAAESRGWSIVELGPRILRVDTAAICLAAAVASL